jgi:hypothetical protein
VSKILLLHIASDNKLREAWEGKHMHPNLRHGWVATKNDKYQKIQGQKNISPSSIRCYPRAKFCWTPVYKNWISSLYMRQRLVGKKYDWL